MTPRITLSIKDSFGRTSKLRLISKRFKIGKARDNDLELEGPNVAKHHAILEVIEGNVCVVDCASEFGTFVNGKRISEPTWLNDKDVLSFGVGNDIPIEIKPQTGEYPLVEELKKQEANAISPVQKTQSQNISTTPRHLYLIALLFGIVLGMSALYGLQQFRAKDKPSVRVPNGKPEVQIIVPPPSKNEKQNLIDTQPNEEKVEKLAQEVMRRISNDDSPYVFPEEALQGIKQELAALIKSATVKQNLNSFSQHPDLGIPARQNSVEPSLAIYLALAENKEKTVTNPKESVGKVVQVISPLKKRFGTELADKSLILAALYRETQTGKPSSQLLQRIQKSVKDPQSERNIWYLHKQGLISDDMYRFILDTIAIGVIVQNPSQFGFQSNPIVF